jgi:hypothetical protein
MRLQLRTIKTFQQFRIDESLSSARKRFVDTKKVDQMMFDRLKAIDPTPTFKYLEAIIGFYLGGTPIEEIRTTINSFDKMVEKNQIKQRDINSYKDFDDLVDVVKTSDIQYGLKQASKEKSRDAKTVYEDERYKVLVPRTHEASCKYGAGTKWCITEENPEAWKMYYDSLRTHYFILDKKLIEILSKKEAIEDDLENERITEPQAKEETDKLERQANNIDRTLDDNLYKIAVSVTKKSSRECVNAADKPIEFDDVLKVTKLDKELFRPEDIHDEETKFLAIIRYLFRSNLKIIDKNEDGSVVVDIHNSHPSSQDISIDDMKYAAGLKHPRLPITVRKISRLQVKGANDSDNALELLNKIIKIEKIEEVDYFIFRNCNITSLEGLIPKKINKICDIAHNKLSSLKGMELYEVGGYFDCSNNQLTSLQGAPQKVGGHFDCSNNQLTSLQGAPQKVEGDFDCHNNQLTSLQGAPQKVGYGGFNCRNNQLTSLQGAPQKVGYGGFDCSDNQLTTLQGAPQELKGWFIYRGNPLPQSEKDWAEKNSYQ